MGSLIRIDASKDYSDENSVLGTQTHTHTRINFLFFLHCSSCTLLSVPRIQFFAIEIARNREGYNDRVRDQFKKTNDAIAKS